MNDNQARIIDIIRGTTVDGPGFRTSIYFAGCAHHCPQCHNPQSWDFEAGRNVGIDELMEVIKEEDFDVTLSGGDPLYQPEVAGNLIAEVRKTGHKVWVYTGFTWEEILADPRLLSAIRNAEVVVDSPFDCTLRDPDLLFRGSANQRLILVEESLRRGEIVTYPDKR